MLNVIVLTLFKDMFTGFLDSSIIKRAVKAGRVDVKLLDIRDFADNLYKKIDDTPYGGGAGMVIMPEPLSRAIDKALSMVTTKKSKVIYMSPRGKVLSYSLCEKLAEKSVDTTYILICGHYEGIDERVLIKYNVEELSIGDYVLTGGELPAMVLIDCVSRLISGVITKESLIDESHKDGRLEYPQYTKPAIWKDLEVPSVLLSGNHKEIENYRNEKSLEITLKNRPDMLNKSNN